MKKRFLRTILIVVSLLVLLPIFGQAVFAQTPEPELGTGDSPASVPTGETPAPAATGVLDDVVMTRTPEPTATPGVMNRE